MKKIIKRLLSLGILTGLFLFSPALCHAQIDPGCDPDIGCPVDGGVIVLIILGLLYGIRKIYILNKNKIVL